MHDDVYGFQLQDGQSVYGFTSGHDMFTLGQTDIIDGKNVLEGRYYFINGSSGSFRFTDTSQSNDGSAFSGPSWWGDVKTALTQFQTLTGTRIAADSFTHDDAFFTASPLTLSGSYVINDYQYGDMRYDVTVNAGVVTSIYNWTSGLVGVISVISGWSPDGQRYHGSYEEFWQNADGSWSRAAGYIRTYIPHT